MEPSSMLLSLDQFWCLWCGFLLTLISYCLFVDNIQACGYDEGEASLSHAQSQMLALSLPRGVHCTKHVQVYVSAQNRY